jgi:hypothetical protein
VIKEGKGKQTERLKEKEKQKKKEDETDITVFELLCILYKQRDATYKMFFIIISTLHVSGGFSAHHQELIKLYVQPWVLSFFPAVYCWCRWVIPTHPHQR